MKKRIVSVFMTLAMLLSLLPASVFTVSADDEEIIHAETSSTVTEQVA